MSMMSLIIVKADFIYKSNNVYSNLNDVEDDYEIKFKVINYLKCYLLQNRFLDSFAIDGIYVDVSKDEDDYYVVFDDYVLYISSADGEIIDYKFR